MPKNKGKGGKNNRRGKKDDGENKRELIFKEDGQEYAQVVKMLGNGRLDAKCQDGENRLAQIRGQMRKKVWIVVGDIVLISLREFQDERADVIHRYTPDEARNLKTYGELKDFQLVENQEAGGESDEEGGIEFEEADIDDISMPQHSFHEKKPAFVGLNY
ncbi:translation initiation factor eIF-1A [Cryptococcus wingfieldii CBS 7118]|uniref:Translation initiation factor eIF-1A n=1 Tax=Cryptococcus wingfieldii CBS 7118 TaxID=1295528 RepID=A0A1E3IEW9_9TREE|nr:translation initiation factor eIF-1A [Cryptococcus wingfieldii CBS 7118]ODN87109.1 translation initiation factor eIF-1A [Cryptococcus wingfieldii CBS 7118]